MSNDNVLDQTVCNLPFEVVTIYDYGSQILQPNTKNNLPPSVNVKIRIRNKEDTERRGIISVPRLTEVNLPKKVRLVSSAQTIMSFNLAVEPNSDEAQKKSNRRIFHMFRPGGCLSIHRDEDGYSYMPSTSSELKRNSASGIEDYESSKITGAFALKKNDFSSSYTNTLKTPKTFLGKCKPGGCLDPPFSEDKYTYKPTVEDVQPLQQPVISTKSIEPDINIIAVKRKKTSQDQKQNILLDSYPDTKILENSDTLVTYPSNLSSPKLKSKDSPNKKLNLRMGEQVDLSRQLTNEFPDAFFIPTRKGAPKNEKSYDKYKYEEKEPKIKEAYVNKDYILKSQTPSELFSDALTITPQPFDERLREKQIIRELNTTTQLLLKSEELLSNNASKDNVKTISTTVSTKDLKKDENTFLQDQNFSNYNNIPIVRNIFSDIKESQNALSKPISRSSIKLNTIPDTNQDVYLKKNADLNNNSDLEDSQPSIYSLELSKEILTKFSKGLINHTRRSLDNSEIIEQNSLLRQHQNVLNNDINKAEITSIRQQIEGRSEENNNIYPFNVNKSASFEYENYKSISGQLISNLIIKDDTHSETDHPESTISVQKSDHKSYNSVKNVSEQMFESITESTKLLVKDLEFKDNIKTEKLVGQGSERTTEQINDEHSSITSNIIPKVTSLHSINKILSLRNSHSFVSFSKNINVNQKDNTLDYRSSKSIPLTNEENNADNKELKESLTTLKKTLSSFLITGHTPSQTTEIQTINTGLEKNLSSKHDQLGDTDTTLITKMLQLSDLSLNNMILDNYDTNQALSITMNETKDAIESLEIVPQLSQKLSNFDSLQYRKSFNYTNKEETNDFNTFINDSKILLTNLYPYINFIKRDILSDDKFRKPSKELTTTRSLQTLSNRIVHQESNEDSVSLLENIHKSESNIETSEKKATQRFDNVQELKIIPATPEIKKSFANNKKNINSISSVAINFGFHTFSNEKTGYSIETFDPSINLANYPQGKTVTVKTILRENESEIKIEVNSETNLLMQIKPTKQLNAQKFKKSSRKLASNILTNDRRTDKIRVHSSETLIDKDKLLQETLKTVYETFITIEKNIIKLKEETESLYREQLLFKEFLISKEMKPNRIIPNVGTCSCLQREIGLDMKNIWDISLSSTISELLYRLELNSVYSLKGGIILKSTPFK